MVDLDAIERTAAGFETQYASDVLQLVAEVRTRRAQAEADLRFMQQQIDEVGSLKRRITELRRGLVGIAEVRCLCSMEEMAAAARAELEADHARRHRFQLKQRKGARRG